MEDSPCSARACDEIKKLFRPWEQDLEIKWNKTIYKDPYIQKQYKQLSVGVVEMGPKLLTDFLLMFN